MVGMSRRLSCAASVAMRRLRHVIRNDRAFRGIVSRHNGKASRITRVCALSGLPFLTQFCTVSGSAGGYGAAMINRRHFMLLGAASLVSLLPGFAHATAKSHFPPYAFTFKGLDGGGNLPCPLPRPP